VNGEVPAPVDIRAARANNPRLGVAERLLLFLNLGGRYYHPLEGRYRTSMTADKGLTWFIRVWLWVIGGWWALIAASIVLPALMHLWDVAAGVWYWIGLSLAPGLLALWWRTKRRKGER
jgi:hypothetical protein